MRDFVAINLPSPEAIENYSDAEFDRVLARSSSEILAAYGEEGYDYLFSLLTVGCVLRSREVSV